jgi:hypothetical protein
VQLAITSSLTTSKIPPSPAEDKLGKRKLSNGESPTHKRIMAVSSPSPTTIPPGRKVQRISLAMMAPLLDLLLLAPPVSPPLS